MQKKTSAKYHSFAYNKNLMNYGKKTSAKYHRFAYNKNLMNYALKTKCKIWQICFWLKLNEL